MRNLEKLGILVIVILVVVVGVVAITPGEQLDKALDLVPERNEQAQAAPERLPDGDRDGHRGDAHRGTSTDERGSSTIANVPHQDRRTETDPRPIWPDDDNSSDDRTVDERRTEPTPAPPKPHVDPQPEPAPAKPRTYTVKKGDSYYRIADKVLGDVKLVKALMAANRSIGPDSLKPGDVLVLPRADGSAPGGEPPTRERDTPRAVPEMKGPGGIYVVRSNDTLTGIAARKLGSSTRWHDIARLNKDILKGSTDIRPGMRLRLPGPRSAPESLGTLRSADPAPSTSRTYTVRSRDTLSSIARSQLGKADRWREIADMNHDLLKGSHLIRAGLVLRLPAK